MSSACSMASTSVAKEISFSRSSARSALMSMSMSALLRVGRTVELDLHPSGRQLRPRDQPLLTVDVEQDAVVDGVDHSAGHGARLGQFRLDQARARAAPVARLREGPVDAR